MQAVLPFAFTGSSGYSRLSRRARTTRRQAAAAHSGSRRSCKYQGGMNRLLHKDLLAVLDVDLSGLGIGDDLAVERVGRCRGGLGEGARHAGGISQRLLEVGIVEELHTLAVEVPDEPGTTVERYITEVGVVLVLIVVTAQLIPGAQFRIRLLDIVMHAIGTFCRIVELAPGIFLPDVVQLDVAAAGVFACLKDLRAIKYIVIERARICLVSASRDGVVGVPHVDVHVALRRGVVGGEVRLVAEGNRIKPTYSVHNEDGANAVLVGRDADDVETGIDREVIIRLLGVALARPPQTGASAELCQATNLILLNSDFFGNRSIANENNPVVYIR